MPTEEPLPPFGIPADHIPVLGAGLRRTLLQFLLRWEYYATALAYLNALLPLQPAAVSLLDMRAKALAGLGRADEAIAVIQTRQSIKICLTSRLLEARLHLDAGDRQGAQAILQELVLDYSSSVSIWELLVELHLARQDYRAALEACHRLRSISPASHAYLLSMLALHAAQGDYIPASGYAARVESTIEGRRSLSIYILRRLRDYYRASNEIHQLQGIEELLATRYEQERAKLSVTLSSVKTAKSTAPPPRRDSIPAPGEGLVASKTISATEEERRYLETVARDLFGYPSLLPGQADVMAAVLRGRDVLAIMPTGGGKSLCYQLPALLDQQGTTLVISPLISLMKDQVDSLPKRWQGYATTINSSLEGDELRQRMEAVAHSQYRLVYAAPERLRQVTFLHTLRRAGVSRLVIDEAHCVSVWGHDFRPDYLYIGTVRAALGNPPLLALTATAPPRVQTDIIRRLRRAEADEAEPMAIVATPVTRSNLYLEAAPVRNEDERLQRLLSLCQAEQGSGIVYVDTRARAEQLADLLNRYGVSAGHYHAGMTPAARAQAQDAFMRGDARVMVATIAFGMGIDKSDIRFISHWRPSASLEAYYQEAGRAGRDGLPARCTLFYAPNDQAVLTKRAKQNLLSIDTLRQIYRAVQQHLAGTRAGRVAIDDLRRDLRVEETLVRVAISFLEEAGLLRRHQDIPRTAVICLSLGAGSRPMEELPDLETFLRAARLRPGQPLPLDLLAVARQAGLNPLTVERQLLAWADCGWLTYRWASHDPLLELLPHPPDAARRIPMLLEEYAALQERHVADIIGYVATKRCRHGHIAGYLSSERLHRCGACDNCQPERKASGQIASSLPSEREQMLSILRCVESAPWNWGQANLRRILRAEANAPDAGRLSPAWGALAFRSRGAMEGLLQALLAAGLLHLRLLDHGGLVVELTDQGQVALTDPDLLLT